MKSGEVNWHVSALSHSQVAGSEGLHPEVGTRRSLGFDVLPLGGSGYSISWRTVFVEETED